MLLYTTNIFYIPKSMTELKMHTILALALFPSYFKTSANRQHTLKASSPLPPPPPPAASAYDLLHASMPEGVKQLSVSYPACKLFCFQGATELKAWPCPVCFSHLLDFHNGNTGEFAKP